MENPATPQKNPYKIRVEKGKTYFWCACGLSLKQPFCDGHHKIEGKFKSVKYIASENEYVFFCGMCGFMMFSEEISTFCRFLAILN